MREQDIQSKILKYLKKQGAKTIKIIEATTNGESDIVCCYNGVFISLEVKTPTGKATPLQEKKLRDVKKAGGIGFIVRSVDEVKNIIEPLKLLSSMIETEVLDASKYFKT